MRKLWMILTLVMVVAIPALAQDVEDDVIDLTEPTTQQTTPSISGNVGTAPSLATSSGYENMGSYDSGLKTTDKQTQYQNFNFDTARMIDPISLVEQGKYKEMKGKVVMALSLRRSKMSKGHANDLQVDWFWGDFLDRTHLRNGRIIYNWCDNPIVALIINTPINLQVKSEFVTQVREICRTYLQECQQQVVAEAPCPPKRRFLLPGSAPMSAESIRDVRYEEGILKLALGFGWLSGGDTNISNKVSGGKNVNNNNNGNVNNNVVDNAIAIANDGGGTGYK